MNSQTSSSPQPTILNSWKEISTYLGRGVRTVQRWEDELDLPVHRVRVGPRSPVFAFEHELRFWLHATRVTEEAREANSADSNDSHQARKTPVHAAAELAGKLLASAHHNRELLNSLAENIMAMQRARSELARARASAFGNIQRGPNNPIQSRKQGAGRN
jgi:hypothetical protein